MPVLSPANVPAEHKFHKAVVISDGQPNLMRNLNDYHLRTMWKIGMVLSTCFHKNLLQKVDFIDAFSLPYGYGVIKVDH